MKMLVKILAWMVAVPVGLVLLMLLAGLVLPREHSASRTLHLKATPEQVWAVLSDHAQDPQWRPDVEKTLRLPDRNGHPFWEDQFKQGRAIRYEDTVALRDLRLVRVIADDGAPFGGTWTFELSPEGAGTRLKLTEEGWVSVPFRFAARYFIGQASSMEAYLKALAARLGESAKPEAG